MQKDYNYQKVVTALREWRKLKDLPKTHPAQEFKSQWDAMAADDTYGFAMYHNRIVVPEAAKKMALASLHVQHTGETKTLMNARQLYYWQGMTRDIKLMVGACQECVPY